MTVNELYQQIISRFYALPEVSELLEMEVNVTFSSEPVKTLRPEGDPPSTVSRPEYCVTADIDGVKGEAYTETPAAFNGTLKQALDIRPDNEGISAITISALNAAMNRLSLCPGVLPKKDEDHASYADAICRYVKEHYGKSRIVLVGYDGYLVKRFVDAGLEFWTLDRDPDNISQDRFDHVVVNSAKRNRESSFAWGDIFIVTGSTLCNGTIVQYLNSGKELYFYGITCAGAATLIGLKWFNPEKDQLT